MQHEDRVRLGHMLEAAQRAQEFVRGRKRQDLNKDEQLAFALVKLLEIIGEAAHNVSDETQQKSPQIPWREIADTRNRLIHGYFDVDLDIVWQILEQDLPPLIAELEKILPPQ